MTGHPVKRICSVLQVSRSTAYRKAKTREPFYTRVEDDLVLEQIRAVTKRRATYGHRRVGARVNRLFGVRYNEKRIRRLMRIHDLQIPPKSRRHTGRAHTGQIATEQSNVRWSSDAFEIACWNGEIVQIGFALDCCDREALAFVAEPRDLCAADIRRLMRCAVQHRFETERTPAAVQWLSDSSPVHAQRAAPRQHLHRAGDGDPCRAAGAGGSDHAGQESRVERDERGVRQHPAVNTLPSTPCGATT